MPDVTAQMSERVTPHAVTESLPHQEGTWRGRYLPVPRPARGVALGLILALSAFLQFYRLNDWQFFSDDQASQLNVMHGLLVDHHPPLLGLALSVGQAHIGPLFYYMLALPLWLGHLDPTAGVGMIGLFQVATVYMIYRLCLLVDAPWAGLCAAALYATSGLVVYWSRFLWPNVAPFFIVLALYALVALAQGRSGYLVVLAGSLAAAAQMQPTALLFIPVALIALAVMRPRVTRRDVALSAAVVAALFAPAILYELTHAFAETRAWLAYVTTVQPGATHTGGPRRGFAALELFGWRVVGFRTRTWVLALLAVATLAVVACALGVAGRPRAVLARLLLLWGALYGLAFSLYHGTLHPHYVEPLYPLPFLAIGLLFDRVVVLPRQLARIIEHRGSTEARGDPEARGLPRASTTRAPSLALYLGTAAVVVGLATANIRHLWSDHFGLDPFQLDTPAQARGAEITLGEMRQAVGIITRAAAGRPYSFLLTVSDGAGGGYQYLMRHSSAPPAPDLRSLQFLLVEPADRPAWQWDAATRKRWSTAQGGFVRLPHLLLWRMLVGGDTATAAAADAAGPWRTTADTGGAISALTVLPGRAGQLLAGFLGGVTVSSDGGARWSPTSWPNGPNGLAVVSSFAWSPACPRRVYAGTFDGIVASLDGGQTWTRLTVQPANTEIQALLAGPRRCGTLLAGTRGGVARTTDGGHSWTLTELDTPHHLAVHSLVLGPDGHTIYAGTSDGVWISADGGRSWPVRHEYAEPRAALSLLVFPAGSRRILAGTPTGLLNSDDGGVTWAPIRSLYSVIYALLSVDRGHTLLAGTDAGLYLSHDAGMTWQRASLPPDVTVGALGAAGPAGRLLYAASSRGLYRSTDGGLTWTKP